MADGHYNFTNCLWNYSDIDDFKALSMTTGITAWMCLLFILFPALTLEIYFTCRYKTTFLIRLSFYLTFAGTIANVNFALGFLVQNPLPKDIWAFQMCKWMGLTSTVVFYFAILLELLLIFLMNLNLLSKMYRHSSNKQSRLTSRKCIFKKKYEALLVISYHLLCAVISTAVIVTLMQKDYEVIRLALFYAPTLVDIIISFISFVVFVIWSFKSSQKGLLSTGSIKEIGIFLAYLILFLLPWSGEAALILYNRYVIKSLVIEIFVSDLFLPLIHATTSLPSFVYICVAICRRRAAKKKQKQQDKNHTIVSKTTAPPSTRVSLPSDTAAHAPNFLSPSTAEPTEVTPLIVNRDMV